MSGQARLFAASVAALIAAFVAGWAVSDSHAATQMVQIDPFKLMTSAKQLPVQQLADYSVIFN